MKVAISQPRYLPAINYIQRLYFCDIFVFLDNVQRQSRGVENRNKILINGESRWVTMPIASSSRALIKDSIIHDGKWVEEHKNIIKSAYRKNPFFSNEIIDEYYKDIYKKIEESNNNFSEVVIKLVMNVCNIFGFKPKIVKASSFKDTDSINGPEKLLAICQELGTDVYISGANGRNYGVKEVFIKKQIETLFHDYIFQEYSQHNSVKFIPWMCFFDAVFNIGLKEVNKWICAKPILEKN